MKYSSRRTTSSSTSTSSPDRDAPTTVPDHFLCPLTLDVMQDPVQHKETGHCFERKAIMDWICVGNGTCPLTRKPIKPSDLVQNVNLQDEIVIWQQLNDVERLLSFHHHTTYRQDQSADQSESSSCDDSEDDNDDEPAKITAADQFATLYRDAARRTKVQANSQKAQRHLRRRN